MFYIHRAFNWWGVVHIPSQPCYHLSSSRGGVEVQNCYLQSCEVLLHVCLFCFGPADEIKEIKGKLDQLHEESAQNKEGIFCKFELSIVNQNC